MTRFDFSDPRVLKWEIQETGENVELVVGTRSNTIFFANFDSNWSLNTTSGSCTLSVSAHIPQSSNPTDNALDNATISGGVLTLSCKLKSNVVSGVLYGGTGELRVSVDSTRTFSFTNPTSGGYCYVSALSVAPQTSPDNWNVSNMKLTTEAEFSDNICVVESSTSKELYRSSNGSNDYRLKITWNSSSNYYDVSIGIPHISTLNSGETVLVKLVAKNTDVARGLPAIWTERGLSFNLTRSL